MSLCEDGEGAPLAKKPRIITYYGIKELSDVVLQVGNTDLHVHKMTLASRSRYFQQLFFSKGSEEKKTFIIDESAYRFENLMRYIYCNRGARNVILCKSKRTLETLGDPNGEKYQKSCKHLEDMWKNRKYAIDVSEKYGLFDDMSALLDVDFLAMDCRRDGCLQCTIRRLEGLHYNFPNMEKNTKLDPKAMVFCLRRVGQFADPFNISTSVLLKILGKNSPERETKAPETAHPDAEIDGPICLEYGDSSLSDVTLVMGKYEFKVHKISLANRSPYFRAMFFSQFKEKDEERIAIEADGYFFTLLLELLYNDNSFEDSDFLECRPGELLRNARPRVDKFWKTMRKIMETMEFFNFPSHMVENPLLLHYCRKDECVECANKKIFAMIYNLANLKKKITSTPSTVVSCLKNFPECLPERLSFTPDDLADLIESENERRAELTETIWRLIQ